MFFLRDLVERFEGIVVWRPRAWTKGSRFNVAANRAENSGARAEAKSKGFADSSSAAAVRLNDYIRTSP